MTSNPAAALNWQATLDSYAVRAESLISQAANSPQPADIFQQAHQMIQQILEQGASQR